MPKRPLIEDSYEHEVLITSTRAPLHVPKPRQTSFARSVQSCCLQERVSYDSRTSAAVSNAGETVVCLNDFSQGTDIGARVGDIAYLKHLQIRGLLTLAGNATVDAYRLTVVLDRECYGNICTYAQVFNDAGAGQTVLSLPNYGNRTRFVPILDKVITIQNNDFDATTGSGAIKEFEVSIPLHFSTKYNGNAGTINDIVANSLCVLQSSRYGNCFVEWRSLTIFRS